ncbi:MAG: hypothetical protein ACP5XB_18960 [Isosphaeraceae bacterium]
MSSKTYVLKMNMPGIQYRSYIYGSAYGMPAGTLYNQPSTPIPRRLALRGEMLSRLARLRQARTQEARRARPLVRPWQSVAPAPSASLANGLLSRHPLPMIRRASEMRVR